MTSFEPPVEEPTLPLRPVGGAKRVSQPSEGSSVSVLTGSTLVGRYRLTDLLGEGGMGRVYKAIDQPATASGGGPAASAVIAIKVLSEGVTEPAGRFAALTVHINRLRRLAHPNIVSMFGCERDGAIAFITMEYLSGESTYSMLHPRASGAAVPLEALVARRVIAAVANALEYAHGQGVVHGDLKPGNVMVSREYGTKVIDFGLTRWRARSGTSDVDAFFPPTASVQYASPQLMAGEEAQPSDDVFGLACVAYELLTGVHPFDGDLATRSSNSAPPQRPGLAPYEYAALMHALQFEHHQRTLSVREFMAEFAPSLPRSSKAGWPLKTAAVAAVAIGVVAVAAFFLWRQDQRYQPPPQTAPAGQPSVPRDVAVEPPAPPPRKGGAVIHDCATCPSMTVLPAGEFQQGAPGTDRDAVPLERPQHPVRIAYLFAVSTADITVADFRRFTEATAREMKGCDTYDGEWRHRAAASWQEPGFAQTARHPVVCVSWNDAVAYAAWLSETTGHRYRLPSASEWEYAARAGALAVRPWSSDRGEACAGANVADRSAERRFPGWQVFPCDDGYVFTAPVGSFASNGFALSDMIGNVLVWTQDCWMPDYTGAPSDGSAREAPGCPEHEVRGGSWFSPPPVVKISYRNHFQSNYRTSSIGVRLVREMD